MNSKRYSWLAPPPQPLPAKGRGFLGAGTLEFLYRLDSKSNEALDIFPSPGRGGVRGGVRNLENGCFIIDRIPTAATGSLTASWLVPPPHPLPARGRGHRPADSK